LRQFAQEPLRPGFDYCACQRGYKIHPEKCTGDVRWNLVGDRLIEGKAKMAEILEQIKNDKAAELTIHHIATHGKAGAADGTMKFKNGKTVAYCNVYEFSNTKGTSVREITSYEIELK
jgi:hypothetical protein